jgi:queuine tRNA-ribosyltransferase subunit QTRTD1
MDTTKKSLEGINKKTAVRLSTIKGFEEFSIEDFVNLATVIKPDILVSLTEEPVADKSGMKSHSRCVDKSLDFLDTTIAELKKQGLLESMPVLGCIQGGKYEDLRKKSMSGTLKREQVKGAVLYGFCQGESIEERTKMIRMLMAEIPKEKIETFVVVLHSKGEPVDILHGLSLGIDCFEVDYPFHLAEEGLAFCFDRFDFMNNHLDEKEKNISEKNFENKKARVIDLAKGIFEMDKGPIWKGCDCYSCLNHTRAYVHHLIKSKEMTANVLLTIHNLHSFEGFFKNVKNSIALKIFPKYVNWFLETQTK